MAERLVGVEGMKVSGAEVKVGVACGELTGPELVEGVEIGVGVGIVEYDWEATTVGIGVGIYEGIGSVFICTTDFKDGSLQSIIVAVRGKSVDFIIIVADKCVGHEGIALMGQLAVRVLPLEFWA